MPSILQDFVRVKSDSDERIVSFLYNQAIRQKYHTLFSWGKQDNLEEPEKKATKFFSLFGEAFKKEMRDKVNSDPKLDDSIQAFLEIGHLRNILVHSNFAEYTYEQKSLDEIFTLFQKAEPFLDYIRGVLK